MNDLFDIKSIKLDLFIEIYSQSVKSANPKLDS